jgi:hypothetical protein
VKQGVGVAIVVVAVPIIAAALRDIARAIADDRLNVPPLVVVLSILRSVPHGYDDVERLEVVQRLTYRGAVHDARSAAYPIPC